MSALAPGKESGTTSTDSMTKIYDHLISAKKMLEPKIESCLMNLKHQNPLTW